ncbi:prepilin peptidase [bacterium]|jgi:leader peptidase (prepilin peptidase)/N-methyltransferase|nr:prepilin peptidase [bacterium]
MAFSLIVLGFIFIIGLVMGSFLNVVILRTVSGESIVFPASKCPKCQTPLKWYHNIPVLSYIFLRGKCAFCKEHISIQYPIVELLTGILFVALFIKFCNPFDELLGMAVMNPISWYQAGVYIIALIATCLFIAIAGTDIIEKKVSDAHTYSLIGLGIISAIIYSTIAFVVYAKAFGMPKMNWSFWLSCPVLYSVANAIIGFVFIEIMALLGKLLIGTRAFGEGDSYIAAGLGALFGTLIGISPVYEVYFLPTLYTLISIFILSLIISGLVAIPMFIKNLIAEKDLMTLGAIAGFVIFAIGYFFALTAGWLDNKWAYVTSTVVLIAAGLFACRELLLRLRHASEQNSLSYLPFGPALVIAGLISLFLFPM